MALSFAGAVSVDKLTDSFVLGVTKPSSLNTGVLNGTGTWSAGTTYTVPMTLTAGNATYVNCRFSCTIVIKSYGNNFINCYFDGPPNWTSQTQRPIIYQIDSLCDGPVQNYYERCTFKPQAPGHSVDCWQGFNAWFNRCDFSNGVDGFDILAPSSNGYNAKMRIDGCYVHDLAYYSPDTNHSDNHTHNDCIQLEGGKNVYSTGSFYSGLWDPSIGDGSVPGTFDANGDLYSGNSNDNYDPPGSATPTLGLRNTNSCIQFNNPGNTDNINFTNDWFVGGASTFNIISTPNVHLNITNCVFGKPLYGASNVLRDSSAGTAVITVSGCKYDDGSTFNPAVGAGRTNLG
jgi:hypothetical protein